MVLSARPRFQNTDAESSQKLCDDVKALADEVAEKFPSIQTELQGSFAEQSKRQKGLDDSVVQGSVLALLILLRYWIMLVPYISCLDSHSVGNLHCGRPCLRSVSFMVTSICVALSSLRFS